MNHRLLGVTLAIFVLCKPALSQNDMSSGHGTLGVLIVMSQGMVIAADSRTTYDRSHHDDRAVKVFKLAEHSGCMIAGTVVMHPRGTWGFDLPVEIGKIASMSLRDDPFIYRDVLEHQLESAIDGGLIQLPAVDFFEDDPQVASVLIAGYSVVTGSKEAKIPDRIMERATKIEYYSRPNPNIRGGEPTHVLNRTYANVVRDYNVLEVDGSGPFAIFLNGMDGLVRGILRGRRQWYMTDPSREVDLTGAAKDPAIKAYFQLRNSNQLNTMSLKQAVELSDALIRQSIQLAGDDFGIGGQIDIATITAREGFRWVHGHDPANKLVNPN